MLIKLAQVAVEVFYRIVEEIAIGPGGLDRN
jgi:hypothetical protein